MYGQELLNSLENMKDHMDGQADVEGIEYKIEILNNNGLYDFVKSIDAQGNKTIETRPAWVSFKQHTIFPSNKNYWTGKETIESDVTIRIEKTEQLISIVKPTQTINGYTIELIKITNELEGTQKYYHITNSNLDININWNTQNLSMIKGKGSKVIKQEIENIISIFEEA